MTVRSEVPSTKWIARGDGCVGDSLVLVCFPPAGGGTYTFRAWDWALGSRFDVWALQLPGRERRWAEPPLTHWRDMVEQITDALTTYGEALREAPFAFFGHSNGAMVAFEVARELRRVGGPAPGHLFASGRRAPHVSVDRRGWHELPDDDLLVRLRRLDGTHSEVLADTELMTLLLPAIRADLSVHASYEFIPDDPLICPITALGGRDDPEVSTEDLREWSKHTASEFRFCTWAGGHFYLNESREGLLSFLRHTLLTGLRGSTRVGREHPN